MTLIFIPISSPFPYFIYHKCREYCTLPFYHTTPFSSTTDFFHSRFMELFALDHAVKHSHFTPLCSLFLHISAFISLYQRICTVLLIKSITSSSVVEIVFVMFSNNAQCKKLCTCMVFVTFTVLQIITLHYLSIKTFVFSHWCEVVPFMQWKSFKCPICTLFEYKIWCIFCDATFLYSLKICHYLLSIGNKHKNMKFP